VEMETTKGTLTIVADGYSAPVNAGNFVDLVERGFYDGLEFLANQNDFVLQIGDPPGPEEGFIDPKTKKYRAIPLEYLIRGESEPMYGITLEDAGIYLADLSLPFSAYGTVALARPGDDPNGGSSQIFFFKFDTELTPPGFNVMDGRYSVFGYLVDGKDVLEQLTANDKIISAKVVQGIDNLIQPS
jgi:peptidylprolyl isomerase